MPLGDVLFHKQKPLVMYPEPRSSCCLYGAYGAYGLLGIAPTSLALQLARYPEIASPEAGGSGSALVAFACPLGTRVERYFFLLSNVADSESEST